MNYDNLKVNSIIFIIIGILIIFFSYNMGNYFANVSNHIIGIEEYIIKVDNFATNFRAFGIFISAIFSGRYLIIFNKEVNEDKVNKFIDKENID